jgi:mevalonate kinase
MAEIFSKGKLILMGEYAVLDGADALCLPLKTGQKLNWEPAGDNMIHWNWSYDDKTIAAFTIHASSLSVVSTTKGDASWAVKLLRLIRMQKQDFLTQGAILEFTNLFPPEWGLGSSSATISSLCRVADVNPFLVNHRLTGGSGADIAAAVAGRWFYYRNVPEPEATEISTPFAHRDRVYFIYSGKKLATSDHLSGMAKKIKEPDLSQVSQLTRHFATGDLEESMIAVTRHEKLLADVLEMKSIAGSFPDFGGRIKSLGAWGGDFFMAISTENEDYVRDYFKKKNYNTLFSWEEMEEKDKF